ncbi:MAG: cbb3-type cytochrome c oxidase subunit 3 [Rhodospirillales bacterium]|nr:MAG: cbb3-type cytochrome c oxidase subunit 3 [Rhodospirillales bacterium]
MTLTELSELARAWWGAWLMLLFLGIVVWALWPSKRRSHEMRRNAEIPFRNDDDAPRADVETR